MNLKLGLASVLFLGIFSGCAFRSQLPAGSTAYVAPEPVVFAAPFAPSPQYAATLEGGPHYTQGPELKRWMPEDTAPVADGKHGRGLPSAVNAKGDAVEGAQGEAVADKGAATRGPVVAAPPPPPPPP
ncbi:MAG: hypothetical protein ABI193_04345, partial [Minicystis sp.]